MLQMINDLFTMSGPDSAIVDAAEQGKAMRDPGGTTLKQKVRITAGAVAALVIVGWLAVIAMALMSGG